MKIPLIKPYITQEIKNKLCEVLDRGYLTEGTITKDLESRFCEYIACNYAIAVTSCTTGLEIALRALKISPDDEIIIPDYTYPATADVISIVGAKTVIVDICRENMLIDYDKLENAISNKTKAIIPVSLFGNPLDYERLYKIKKKYSIYIIEDAACSIGAEFNYIRVGNLADITVFSFHPRKFITTGEGGMITTNNKKWAEWMNSYKHFGMKISNSDRNRIEFDMIGTNYKLSNILAAIGLAQMNHIDELISKRIRLAQNYVKLLTGYDKITIPKCLDNCKHTYQSFCVFIQNRNKVIQQMKKYGIEVQIGTYSLHMHKAFLPSQKIRIEDSLSESKYAFDHCLTLPLYHELDFSQQEYIIAKLIDIT